MEMSVASEENLRGLCTPISNSSTPLIKIDSISIDLVNGNEKMTDIGNCTHFSIRGYVAEIRKKDAKSCWPFAIDDKINSPEDHTYTLPPLEATKFRWWRCQSCVREIDPLGTSKEIEAVPNCTHTEAAALHLKKKNRWKSLEGVVSSLIDKREKEVELAHTTFIGKENVKKDSVNQEFPKPTCDSTKSNPFIKLGRHTGTFESDCNGFVKTCNRDCEINAAAHDRINTTNLNSQIKGKKSVDVQNKELLTVCDTCNSHASDDESSESDEMLGENNILDQLDDDSSFFHRQKPQKVRLLAEILVGNGNANTASITEDDGPSSASPGVDTFSVSRDRVARKESLGKGVMKGPNKKRKMPNDGHFGSLEISSPNSENKKNKIFKGDFESTVSTTGAKSNKDASPETGKKKIKKMQDDDRCFSLFPLQEVAHRKNEKIIQDSDKSNYADTPLRCFFPAQGTEKKSSMFKKKNKMHQAQNLQAFLMPWNNDLLRENLITGHSFETMQNGPKGLPHFCYENYLAAQEKNRNYFFGKDQITRKDEGKLYVGESSVPYDKSAADAFIDKEVRWDLNIKTGPNVTSLVHEKRSRPSRDVNGELSSLQKMDVFGKSKSEKPIKIKEQPEFGKKYGGQRDDKVLEQGTATDDIPMEIVELLAKHQYEKRLHDAGKVPPRNGEKVDLNKFRTDREINSLLIENSPLQKSQCGNSNKNMFVNGEDAGHTHQKTINDFPHMSLQEGSQISRGFQAFSHKQNHVSNGVQFPATNSSKHNMSFPTSFHPFKAYDPCLVPHHKPAGIRPSVTQNHTLYEPSMNIPQYYEPRTNTLEVVSQRLSTFQNGKINGDLTSNFLNRVGACESQSQNFGARPINGKNREDPYYPRGIGSADMYSNDTIPAMHLLSLMDSGMGRSTPPFGADEKSKFLKSSHVFKDVYEQDMGLNKTINHASRHIPYVDYRKNSLSEKSCECYSSVPSFGALTTSIQNDISIRRATTDFLGQYPVNSRGKGKAKRSYSPTKTRVPKSHKSASTSVGFFGTSGGFRPVLSPEKRFLGASQLKHNELEPQNVHGNVSPLKRKNPETAICNVNRNPADFSVLGSGNMYMIGAEDLKCGKRIWSGNIAALVSVNREKNQKLMKMSAAKEKTRNKIP